MSVRVMLRAKHAQPAARANCLRVSPSAVNAVRELQDTQKGSIRQLALRPGLIPFLLFHIHYHVHFLNIVSTRPRMPAYASALGVEC